MMSAEFVSYRKFSDMESAEQIAGLLRKEKIECHLQDNTHAYVKIVGYNEIDLGITLNIKGEDFPKADKILEAYYSTEIDQVDKDYYLFEFTDQELKDILSHPYEWGMFDYQLAKKILKGKGIEYSEDFITAKKEEKINELSKIKKIPLYKLIIGYLLALFFPPGGMINGFLIVNNRNILPNGQKFYIHSEADRKHGKIIIAISICWMFLIIAGAIKERM